MSTLSKKIAFAVSLVSLGFGSTLVAKIQPTLNDRVKAAYLYNFARFVEWPAEAFSSGTSEFIIGVVGDPDFADYLRATLSGQSVNGRPIDVVALQPESSKINQSHVIYVTQAIADPSRVIQKVSGADVLTVGETRTFTREGGMIRFLIEDDALRFAVNANAVDRTHLKISSQMLQFAKNPDKAR